MDRGRSQAVIQAQQDSVHSKRELWTQNMPSECSHVGLRFPDLYTPASIGYWILATWERARPWVRWLSGAEAIPGRKRQCGLY